MVAFDATNGAEFTFNAIGGSQVVANELVITNQVTSEIAYQEVQNTFVFSHALSGDILENGEYYSAVIYTYDAENNKSIASNAIQFFCFSAPTFALTNIPESGIIANSSFAFTLEYNQTENERLSSYSFNLYDAQQTRVATSGVKYVGGDFPPNNIQYTFSGMTDSTVYFVQCQGVTEHGTELDTGLYEITVRFEKPNVYSIVELSNNCTGGYVVVKSNLVSIYGNSFPSIPTYVDGYIDLSRQNAYVKWDSGFTLSDDFTLSLWGKNFNLNENIIELTNKSGEYIRIFYREDDDGRYLQCFVNENGITYFIFSNYIDVEAGEDQMLWLRRIGNLYELKIQLIEESVEEP